MRTTPLSWLLARLKPALFTALIAAGLTLLLLCPANAAPVEEDLPPPAHHVKPHAEPSAETPSGPSAPSDEPARQPPPAHHVKAHPEPSAEKPSGPSVPSDEPSSQPSQSATDRPDATPSATAAAVHKYFPYTIRAGDTLESIADIFGVQVADITRANRGIANGDLRAGETIRIPNPFVTRQAELKAEVERLSIDKAEAERKADKADQANNALASLHSQLESAAANNAHYEHDIHALTWWRVTAWIAVIAFVVSFGVMLAALIEWWNLRSRYRAVAEMNDSLRRLDHRYRMVVARIELRLQELYGRRRRGIEDGQERPKIPEETELEQLDLQIKKILESYLEQLGPPNNRARRARWRELIGAVGAPVEARTERR
jgi:LysM repeat protein